MHTWIVSFRLTIAKAAPKVAYLHIRWENKSSNAKYYRLKTWKYTHTNVITQAQDTDNGASRRARLRRHSTLALKEAIAYLCSDILDSPRSVRDEDSRGLGWSTNFLHCVEVLSDEDHVHDILRGRPRHILREGKHTLPQSIYDGLPLTSYTQPR